MSTFKDRGIVLKEYSKGEDDKVLVVLLKEWGKILVYARGAKKTSSKFFSATQSFCYCDFVVSKRNNFLSLNQAEIIYNFYNISSDYEKFCYANYFAELIDKMIQPSMPTKNILLLLIKSLDVLSKDKLDKNLVFSIFLFKFLQIEGYSPELEFCSNCGNETEILYFGTDGIICHRCLHIQKNYMKINYKVAFVINYILNSDIEKVFYFKTTEDVILKLKSVSEFFALYNTEIILKSSRFL